MSDHSHCFCQAITDEYDKCCYCGEPKKRDRKRCTSHCMCQRSEKDGLAWITCCKCGDSTRLFTGPA
jgi:hypothetical protein